MNPENHSNIQPSARFVHLQTFNNYVEAHIVLKMLQDAGINCHLADEHLNTIVNLSSGMRLMVFHSQAVRAKSLLDSAEKTFMESIPCTSCGQQSLQLKLVEVDVRPQLGGILSFFSRWFSDEGTMVTMKNYYCTACGTVYEDLPMPG